MQSELTIFRPFFVERNRHGQKELRPGCSAPKRPRVPRIARLMALAVRMDGLLRQGTVRDQAELARLGHVSRARLTQIMNLLLLAPDIQEELLFADESSPAARIRLRSLQPIATTAEWRRQRSCWTAIKSQTAAVRSISA